LTGCAFALTLAIAAIDGARALRHAHPSRCSAGGNFDNGEIGVIIDWHSHIYTPEETADDRGAADGKSGSKWGERGCPMVLENFLDAHYKNGIDISVVTNAAHYLRGKAEHEELPAVQRWSDYAEAGCHLGSGAQASAPVDEPPPYP
jgi:hypothetical protein